MQPRSCQEGERSRESACLQCAFTPLAGARRRKRRTRSMVHGKNRIPYRIDRRLTGLAGPDYDATISFGLPLEPEDSQYGKSRLICESKSPGNKEAFVPAGRPAPLYPLAAGRPDGRQSAVACQPRRCVPRYAQTVPGTCSPTMGKDIHDTAGPRRRRADPRPVERRAHQRTW